MNILVNAYACRPNFGSEAGAAWKWITGLARNHDLFVITEGEWQEDIEKELPSTPNGGHMHFYFNPVTEEVRKMCWNQGDYRFYAHYANWQRKTLEIAKGIMQEVKIDLIHQLNMIGFREPGYLWKITGPKFVWGPIGGMNQVPMQYLKDAPLTVRIKYVMKNTVNSLQYHYQPRVLKTIKRADALIAANKDAYSVLTRLHPKKKVYLINETGSNATKAIERPERSGVHFDLLFVGRFIPTKLLGMALQVVASLKELPGLKFHIVGKAFDEAETERYHKMASEMGLDDIVIWHGWLQHNEVQELMRQSDVFFFPSVVEGTPHVVLEAIANGLPVVCFDSCGQAQAVNETVGRKIALSNPMQSIKDFAMVLKELYDDRVQLKTLSDGCEKRRKELSWESKIEEMEKVYKAITTTIIPH